MALVVLKFGGTSVGTPERIHAVADRITRARQAGDRLVVVVSAMGDTTDDLIELAHKVSKAPPHREMDMLLTVGERISMALLSMALSDRGVQALSLTGSQSGIITDGSHRRARIHRILGDRVRAALDAGQVAIVAGFQGVSEKKEITTLGRGGSDTTAVALAAALGAERCDIFTDVDGVFSADPRKVKGARHWPRLPADLMVELAVRGAGVLHPRSVELAAQAGVKLRVLNSLKAVDSEDSRNGTEVEVMTGARSGMEEFSVVGVTADSTKARVSVKLARPGIVGAIWDRAADLHLLVLAPVFSENRVTFFAEKDAEGDWKAVLQDLGKDGFLEEFKIDDSFVPVSVVGHRFSQDGAALGEILSVLAKNHVLVTEGHATSLAVTLTVAASRAADAVQCLHDHFFGNAKKQ